MKKRVSYGIILIRKNPFSILLVERKDTFSYLYMKRCLEQGASLYQDEFNTLVERMTVDEFLTLFPNNDEIPTSYTTREFGFPKGRKRKGETDLQCAVREMYEETGFEFGKDYTLFSSNFSHKENHVGTDMVMYDAHYFVGIMQDDCTKSVKCQEREIKSGDFFTEKECLEKIRPYEKSKINLVKEIFRENIKYLR